MARILIGWELGGNRGHAVMIGRMVAALQRDGHEIALALQQLDTLGGQLDPAIPVFQAPIWPRLLTSQRDTAVAAHTPVSTMIDILARLGLDRPGCLSGLIAGWDAIIAAWRPDLVMTQFAPALLCAARGRVRTVAIGTGFGVPPGQAPSMLPLWGAPRYDEAVMLDTIDADLHIAGRPPLVSLPALFAADAEVVATFAALDPYAAQRTSGYCAPPVAAVEIGPPGDEVFVYAFERDTRGSQLWAALVASRLKVRAYLPDASDAFTRDLRAQGIIIEVRPVPWPLIAQRSRLAISNGGHGFICSALLAGVPLLVTPCDLEKYLHGMAVARIGAGHAISIDSGGDAMRAAIEDGFRDDALARARAAAPGFARAATPAFDDAVRSVVGRASA